MEAFPPESSSIEQDAEQHGYAFFDNSRIDVMVYLKHELVNLFVESRKCIQHPISEYDIKADYQNPNVTSSVIFTIGNGEKTSSALGLPPVKKDSNKEEIAAID